MSNESENEDNETIRQKRLNRGELLLLQKMKNMEDAKKAKAAERKAANTKQLREQKWNETRKEYNIRMRSYTVNDSRERMKKAMQDLGMAEELKLYFE